ncbi:MAG TPA: flavodoxin domain-containing protein [Gaiellaceae bacterium]|nr:flavodoxin domain-containing protein [Gaiellaceae bacterium]
MAGSVLVAYATKKGSTREVAEAIAGTLRAQGLEVELRPAGEVGDVGGYDGVVLGGALYMARWHPDARQFLRRHRKALATLPVAVFGMGPLALAERDVAGSRQQLERALAKTPEVNPVSVAIFGAVVDPAKLRFPFSHMPATDARDWDAIRAWAEEVAAELVARETVAPGAVTAGQART